MSKSSPADLTVAFRSVERRRREAIAAADGAPVNRLLSELDRHLTDAATLVGAAAEPSAIADAIAARPADEWDEMTLDALREHATAAGSTLRHIAEAGGAGDG